jgi:glycosyltransferase involved in cell wall biosynthesis
VLKAAYRACDLIVDIGPCMRKALAGYGSSARCITLPPWALVEPLEPLPTIASERETVFGDARLGLSYSGNFGRAHSHDLLLALARKLRGDGRIRFAFSIRGNRAQAVHDAVTEADTNVSFVPFAPIERLRERLGAADVHLVSLRPEWTGAVVPSKFFGALAAGRPVIFAGSADSGLAHWIREHRVGWLLTAETLDDVAYELRRLVDAPGDLAALRKRCHEVYTKCFSREHLLDRWDEALRALPGMPYGVRTTM